MDALRKPFLLAAVVLLLVVVVAEVGGGLLIKGSFAGNVCNQMPDDIRDECDPDEINNLKEDVPGLGIPYLALVDGLLLFALGQMAVALVLPESFFGRVQGLLTFIVALLLLLATVVLILVALAKLLAMVGLFLAAPFGTLAYFAIFSFFPRGGAAAMLSVILVLKVVAAGCIVLAQQRFLQNKGLVFLILTGLLGSFIVSFLHGLVPIFLVSITDALAAIIVGILGAIWQLVLLIGAIPAIIKAVV